MHVLIHSIRWVTGSQGAFRRWLFVIALAAWVICPAAVAHAGGTVYLLKDAETGLELESVPLETGRVQVFPIGAGTGNVTVILPYGPGMSGDIVDTTDGHLLIAMLTSDVVRLFIRRPDSKDRPLPPVAVNDLTAYDMRVNVVTADGRRQAFVIDGGREVREDVSGPVFDAFGGRNPIEAGRYAVSTESSRHRDAPLTLGDVPLRLAGGDLIARGQTAPGKIGDFIIDTAAGGTVIVRSFLPEGTAIDKVTAAEHSPAGTRIRPGTMSGAGGDVSHFLGNAHLTELRLGTLVFKDVVVRVIDGYPGKADEEDVGIAGILGLDLLRRAPLVAFGYPGGPGSEPTLEFSEETGSAAGVPFSLVPLFSKHIFVRGDIGGTPVHFILDTGAPEPFITTAVAEAASVVVSPSDRKEFRGLGENVFVAHSATVDALRLGSGVFSDVALNVADVPVLKKIGLERSGGLLGASFLQRFRRIEIDFGAGVVRLIR